MEINLNLIKNESIQLLSPLTKMSWADINELEQPTQHSINQHSTSEENKTLLLVNTEILNSSLQSKESNNIILKPLECLYFKKGICVFGDKCDFLHDNVGKEIPECKYNPCMFGKKCIYKHSKQLKQKKSTKRLEFKGNDADFTTHSMNNHNDINNSSLTKKVSKVKPQPQQNKNVTKTKPTVEMCEECGEFLVNNDKCQSCCY